MLPIYLQIVFFLPMLNNYMLSQKIRLDKSFHIKNSPFLEEKQNTKQIKTRTFALSFLINEMPHYGNGGIEVTCCCLATCFRRRQVSMFYLKRPETIYMSKRILLVK